MSKVGGTKVGNFLRSLVEFFKNLTAKTRELTPEILQVVNNVKNFVDSPGCDFLTAVIPGTWDNWLQDLMKAYLPKLLDILNKVESYAEIADPNERMKAIVANMQLSEGDLRDVTFQPMAAKLVEKATENPYGKSVIIAESAYQNPEVLAA